MVGWSRLRYLLGEGEVLLGLIRKVRSPLSHSSPRKHLFTDRIYKDQSQACAGCSVSEAFT